MPEPFQIDVYGQFGPECLRIVWRHKPRPRHPALDALVAETWERQVEAARREGRLLFNGQLARYLRHRAENGTLVIEVGPTDYANFLATNLLNWRLGRELGWDLFSNPIGTSAVPLTSDGFLLLGRRNDRVAFHAGHVHTFGGTLEAADRRPDGTVDAFGSIRRELDEELAIGADTLNSITCLGLIRDSTIRQPELVFETVLSVTRDEVAGRLDPAHSHQEHAGIAACRDDPDAILPFIRAHSPITPVAVGALCLHGRQRFGESWYARAVCELSG